MLYVLILHFLIICNIIFLLSMLLQISNFEKQLATCFRHMNIQTVCIHTETTKIIITIFEMRHPKVLYSINNNVRTVQSFPGLSFLNKYILVHSFVRSYILFLQCIMILRHILESVPIYIPVITTSYYKQTKQHKMHSKCSLFTYTFT